MSSQNEQTSYERGVRFGGSDSIEVFNAADYDRTSNYSNPITYRKRYEQGRDTEERGASPSLAAAAPRFTSSPEERRRGALLLIAFSLMLVAAIWVATMLGELTKTKELNTIHDFRKLVYTSQHDETPLPPPPRLTPATDSRWGEGVHTAVVTSHGNAHRQRYLNIMRTWWYDGPTETVFVVDPAEAFDQDLSRRVNGLEPYIHKATGCGWGQSRANVCCKTQFALLDFLYGDPLGTKESDDDRHHADDDDDDDDEDMFGRKKGMEAGWFCLFQETQYVNFLALRKLLSGFDSKAALYIGRPASSQQPFALGKAGYCLSRAAVLVADRERGLDQLKSRCVEDEISADEAIGAIMEATNIPLTESSLFHYQDELEPDNAGGREQENIPAALIPEQVSWGSSEWSYDEADSQASRKEGFAAIPLVFAHQDPFAFRSLRCFLQPLSAGCPDASLNDDM